MFGPIPMALQDSLYQEPLRPQFHFTAQEGWLNDPNGLVFYKGEYHMFFQHTPHSTQSGDKYWGHAVSRDLVHWRQVDEAIVPDERGAVWSGSAVVDKKDTSGLGAGALVLFYTAAGGTTEASKGASFTQCVVSSLDGRTFAKLPTNPVLENQADGNRDPKVVWDDGSKKWVMALYLTGDRYALFGSPNLTQWTKLSELEMPGTGECPDFFPMPLDGNKRNKVWVFWGANGNYKLGSFDGTDFKPATEIISANFGANSYAAQTFFNDPKGRRVQVCWMAGSDFPGTAWNQQMGFPRVMTLRSTELGARLCFEPVGEVSSLRLHKLRATTPSGTAWNDEFDVPSGLAEIDLEAKSPGAGNLTVNLLGRPLTYDAATSTLTFEGKSAQVFLAKGKLDLRILVDRTSVEIFAQKGLVTMPFFVLPKAGVTGITVGGSTGWRKEKLDVYELRSAWR